MALPAFLEPISNLPKSAKLGLGFGGIVAVAAAAYFLVISPSLERVARLEAEHTQLQAQIQQNRMILAQLEMFRKQAVQLEQQLAGLTVKLPSEKEMPPLYRTLSDTAFQAGLAVSLFKPQEARIRDYYAEIPITVTAEGGYHDLAGFFDKLASMPRVVTVNDWKLTGLNRTKQPLRADVTLATYTYRPVGSPPAPKPGDKK